MKSATKTKIKRGRRTSLRTHVSQVDGDLQIADELDGELRIHLEDVEKIVPQDLVKVAVGQRAHVAARLADQLVLADVLSENVLLACSTERR